MYLENPPFPRGTTFYNGRTIDANNLEGLNLEGCEVEFDDIDLASTASVKPRRTPGKVRCRIVRNVSTAYLLPKRAATGPVTAGNPAIARVDGMAEVFAERVVGIVDEFVSSTGVTTNDLCYVVVKGPSMWHTAVTGMNTSIAVGDRLVAATAAASTGTTAGRANGRTAFTTTNSTGTALADQIENVVGLAMSARTTNETSSDILCYITRA